MGYFNRRTGIGIDDMGSYHWREQPLKKKCRGKLQQVTETINASYMECPDCGKKFIFSKVD